MYMDIRKGKKPERMATVVLVASFIFFLTSPAHAHRIKVFAYTVGSRVTVEASYAGGKDAVGAKVNVVDAAGGTVAKGRIGLEGHFSFEVVDPGELRVSVTDGKGHRGTYILEKGAFHARPSDAEQAISAAGHEKSPGESDAGSAESKVREDVLQKELEAMIDRKMEPIKQELKEIRRIVDRPPVRDVVAGVGYIAGLVGLVFFLLGQKREGRK